MKTTTVNITDEIAQMIISLLDAGMKHPELGGARMAMPGAIVLQWLQPVQEAFNAMDAEGQVPEVDAKGPGKKSKKAKATDLEGKS